jgi:pimeloyl-ACP methyl ester carboxylesterase
MALAPDTAPDVAPAWSASPAAWLDLSVRGALRLAHGVGQQLGLDPVGRALRTLPGLRARVDAQQLLARPPAARPLRVQRGRHREEWLWASAYRPALAPHLATLSTANRTARALRRSTAPSVAGRDVVVVVHGFNTGAYALEERLWPQAALQAAGFEVMFLQQPFHGARKAGGFGLPPWPSAGDIAATLDGCAWAASDVTALVLALRAQGARSVSAWGMSLGAHTALLAASAHEGLVDAVAAVTPLGSFPDLLRQHGHIDADAHAALAATCAAVTPLSRDLSRVRHGIVVGAECDAITSMRQAVDVARALAAPLVTIPGGHLAPAGLSSTWDRLIAHTRAAVDGAR